MDRVAGLLMLFLGVLLTSQCVRADVLGVGGALSDGFGKLTDAAKEAAKGGMDFFKNSVSKVTDLFGTTKAGLLEKVGKVKGLLTGVQAGKDNLMEDADDAQKEVLGKTDAHLSKVTAFETELQNSDESAFDSKKKKWEDMMNGGMGSDLMKMAGMANGGHRLAATTGLSLVALVAAAAALYA